MGRAKKIDSTHGVLQGGIISPKLFNVFLADLYEFLDQNHGVKVNGNTFTHLVYADDLVLLSDSNTGMQTLLSNVQIFCQKWHLIVNTSKTKVMIFNKRNTTCRTKNWKYSTHISILDMYYVLLVTYTRRCTKI